MAEHRMKFRLCI